jgi:hypothetical protein
MKPLKERPWIGTRRGKGGEEDLYRCGKDWSTLRHLEKRKRWSEFNRMAADRTRWRHFVDALCPIRDNRNR